MRGKRVFQKDGKVGKHHLDVFQPKAILWKNEKPPFLFLVCKNITSEHKLYFSRSFFLKQWSITPLPDTPCKF